jgi:hypothetical protein
MMTALTFFSFLLLAVASRLKTNARKHHVCMPNAVIVHGTCGPRSGR